jgi:hypothetical protein
MRRFTFGVFLTALGCAAISAQSQTAPLQRIIEKPQAVHAPAHVCGSEAPWAVLKMGETAGVLTGAERLPGRCAPTDHSGTEVVQLQGLTVEAALNKIVAIDPRYEWRERHGVIVIRPVAAWGAADNPLNLEMPGFATRDRNMRGALDAFSAIVLGKPPAAKPDREEPTEFLRRTFSVTTRTGPAIDALDDIIRAHGALNWMASYRRRPASGDTLSVLMFGFDGVGTLEQRHSPDSTAEEEIVDDPLQRIVDNDFEVQLPLHACSVPATVGKIVKRHQVPAGIEYLPESCPPTPPRGAPTPSVSLAGMTVAAALDKLTALDSRYRWVESNGVAVVRPAAAWADPKNVLNFESASFTLQDTNLDDAVEAIASAIDDREARWVAPQAARTNQGSRQFSVKTGPTSLGGALDAIIRAHGDATWELKDFGPADPNRFMKMLSLYTFDGGALLKPIKNTTR